MRRRGPQRTESREPRAPVRQHLRCHGLPRLLQVPFVPAVSSYWTPAQLAYGLGSFSDEYSRGSSMGFSPLREGYPRESLPQPACLSTRLRSFPVLFSPVRGALPLHPP